MGGPPIGEESPYPRSPYAESPPFGAAPSSVTSPYGAPASGTSAEPTTGTWPTTTFGSPGTGPAAPSGPTSGGPGRRGLLLVLAGVAILVGIAVAAIFLLGRDVSTTATSTSTTSISSTTTSTTSSTTRAGGSTVPGASQHYVDPNGAFELSLGPDWHPPSSSISGLTAWAVGQPVAGFQPSVNVVVATAPINLSLSDITSQSVKELEQLGPIAGVSSTDTTLADGTPAVLIRYQNSLTGTTVPAEVLVAASGHRVVSITVTAAPGHADEMFAAADPYIRSLQIH